MEVTNYKKIGAQMNQNKHFNKYSMAAPMAV
jgi:hypothetical protein